MLLLLNAVGDELFAQWQQFIASNSLIKEQHSTPNDDGWNALIENDS